MGNIFENLLGESRIFENKDVLRPSYVPGRLPHREEQIECLARALAPALRGETPSNILVYGKPGTGKTATVRYVERELKDAACKVGSKCMLFYLNCEIIDTQYRVFAAVARQLSKNVPMTGWPTDHVYQEFKNALDAEGGCAIIILDEIDKLVSKGDEALYTLSRMNSELRNARISIIGISNDLTFTERLDPRVKSSLGQEEIVFPPYNAVQLRDILEQRAKIAFKEGVLDDDVIPLCAAFAAQEHGDARRALDLLRVAGELAERENAAKVRGEHVKMAKNKIEADRIAEVVRTLPLQSKLVLSSILLLDTERRKRRFSTGEVYNMYRKLCKYTGTDVLTQRRVTDLISELDALGLINAVVISKGRYGRTREISLSVPSTIVKSVLFEDYKLSALAGVRLKVQMTL